MTIPVISVFEMNRDQRKTGKHPLYLRLRPQELDFLLETLAQYPLIDNRQDAVSFWLKIISNTLKRNDRLQVNLREMVIEEKRS